MEIGTRWLVDGGLTAPVPTLAARELGATHVIGVSVGMQDGHTGKPSNVFQVVARAVCAAQKHQLELWERHADLVIRPDVQRTLRGTISIARTKRSRPEKWRRDEHCHEFRNCWAATWMPARRTMPAWRTGGIPGQRFALHYGGDGLMNRYSALMAAIGICVLIWQECAENPAIFCYRIGTRAFCDINWRGADAGAGSEVQ